MRTDYTRLSTDCHKEGRAYEVVLTAKVLDKLFRKVSLLVEYNAMEFF